MFIGLALRKRMANFCNCVVERFVSPVPFAPDFVKQLLSIDDITCAVDEAEQHLGSLRWQMRRPPVSGDLACQRPDRQFTDLEPLQEFGLHRRPQRGVT